MCLHMYILDDFTSSPHFIITFITNILIEIKCVFGVICKDFSETEVYVLLLNVESFNGKFRLTP